MQEDKYYFRNIWIRWPGSVDGARILQFHKALPGPHFWTSVLIEGGIIHPILLGDPAYLSSLPMGYDAISTSLSEEQS